MAASSVVNASENVGSSLPLRAFERNSDMLEGPAMPHDRALVKRVLDSRISAYELQLQCECQRIQGRSHGLLWDASIVERSKQEQDLTASMGAYSSFLLAYLTRRAMDGQPTVKLAHNKYLVHQVERWQSLRRLGGLERKPETVFFMEKAASLGLDVLKPASGIQTLVHTAQKIILDRCEDKSRTAQNLAKREPVYLVAILRDEEIIGTPLAEVVQSFSKSEQYTRVRKRRQWAEDSWGQLTRVFGIMGEDLREKQMEEWHGLNWRSVTARVGTEHHPWSGIMPGEARKRPYAGGQNDMATPPSQPKRTKLSDDHQQLAATYSCAKGGRDDPTADAKSTTALKFQMQSGLSNKEHQKDGPARLSHFKSTDTVGDGASSSAVDEAETKLPMVIVGSGVDELFPLFNALNEANTRQGRGSKDMKAFTLVVKAALKIKEAKKARKRRTKEKDGEGSGGCK